MVMQKPGYGHLNMADTCYYQAARKAIVVLLVLVVISSVLEAGLLCGRDRGFKESAGESDTAASLLHDFHCPALRLSPVAI
jgi:hypothetical protein